MRGTPQELTPERLVTVLAAGWSLHVASMHFVPEGGGAYHWRITDEEGRPHFVTVDDLDNKEWFGTARQAVFDGLRRALRTAAKLGIEAGLDFVVAPVAARDGDPLQRLDDRYAVSVFPFLAGHSGQFGPYRDVRLRDGVLDMIAALHKATPAVKDGAPLHFPGFTGRGDLASFLLDPADHWDGGPFSEAAHQLLSTRAAELAELTNGFDSLAATSAATGAHTVITHGEPHPANLMSAGGRLFLIDWDTAALATPERDVSLIAGADNEGLDRYQQLTGRELDPSAILLYRLRWYLDDLGSAVRLFRNRHDDTPDTRRWSDSLAPLLRQLPDWLDRLI